MIFKNLWERYLLKETLKVFFLFLLSFFFLYTLIDYSMHMQEIFKGKQIAFEHLMAYYGMLFSKHLGLLLPLSLLIATMKVLCSLNSKNELLAFQAGGISLKQMMRPFLFLGFVCLTFSTLNSQFIIPNSHSYLYQFQRKHFHKKKSYQKKKNAVSVMPLEDGSRLIYQQYHPDKAELFDVYWLLSANDIWYIKTLSISEETPIGFQVDHLFRNENGIIEKGDSYASRSFENLKINFNLKYLRTKPLENLSLSELYSMQKHHENLFQQSKNTIRSQLYYKLLLPCLSLLVVIAAAPFAVRFSRQMSSFLIFAVGIFGYLALFTILGATLLLGEAQVLPPFWALFTTPLLTLLFFGKKYLKMG